MFSVGAVRGAHVGAALSRSREVRGCTVPTTPVETPRTPLGKHYTERFIYYRKAVLHLLKLMCHVHLSRCSTDLR